ncbi:MAG: hypothetical protein M3311_08485 [Thermoproteota archaeon]|nr:hypothetical protein [Thermoproteota archaeon]
MLEESKFLGNRDDIFNHYNKYQLIAFFLLLELRKSRSSRKMGGEYLLIYMNMPEIAPIAIIG